MPNDMVVFAGRSNPWLFQECFTHNKLDAMFDYPALPSGGGEISQFSDGELFFSVQRVCSWTGLLYFAKHLRPS